MSWLLHTYQFCNLSLHFASIKPACRVAIAKWLWSCAVRVSTFSCRFPNVFSRSTFSLSSVKIRWKMEDTLKLGFHWFELFNSLLPLVSQLWRRCLFFFDRLHECVDFSDFMNVRNTNYENMRLELQINALTLDWIFEMGNFYFSLLRFDICSIRITVALTNLIRFVS